MAARDSGSNRNPPVPEDRRRRRRPHTTTAEQVEVAGRGAAEHDEASTQPVDVPAQRLERAEERLVPRVHRADVGEVVVTKHVVEEPETVTVTLAHDKLALQRTGVNRPLEPGEQPITNRGEETLLLVVEERLEVRKVPYVVEEIRLRRQVVREERQVTDTVRKERFDIDPRGAVELREDDG